MHVAIIGTGNVGKALGGTLVRAGHEVTITASDAAKTRAVAAEIGAEAAATPAQAVQDADLVVLAVPFGALDAVGAALGDDIAGKVVVDVSNPLTPDYSALATSGGPSPAERLAERLRGARVAKAFNTIFANVQADPTSLGTTVDGYFATDDERARAMLHELLGSIGFRPVHVGPLEAARELESLAWLNMRLQMQTGGDWRSAYVLVGVPEAATSAPVPAGSSAR